MSRGLIAGLGLLVAIALAALAMPAAANANGGLNPDRTAERDNSEGRTVPGKRARLRNGLAIPPRQAPRRVQNVIRAANEIAKGKGYCLGGGHGRYNSRCYDCSGAVSYALRGGNLVKGSRPSSGYFRWGKRGRGNWITVFTNSGHMYMTVAGLRFDTGMTPGTGPSWSAKMRSARGFRARHRAPF